MEIRGRNALVTGAAGGIGQASALMLAERGAATVVIADLDLAALEATAEQVEAFGVEAVPLAADLSHPDEIVSLFERAEAVSGGLDIFHNNAGIMAGAPDFPDTSIEQMIAVIQVNLIAMMVGTRLAVESLRHRGVPGVIVNTASMAAFGPMPADPAYAASKAGIVNFTESCRPLKDAFRIRVMAICPGITDTAIVPHDADWLQPALTSLEILAPAQIAEAVRQVIEDDSQAGRYVKIENVPRGK